MQTAILPRLSQLYREVFGDDPEEWREASPISHLQEGLAYPPFLVLYVASRPDSRSQSIALAKKLRAVGGRAEAIGYPGKTHATINREFGLPGDAPSDAAMKFIDEAFASSKH
jgi:acetyl esterase/lipase